MTCRRQSSMYSVSFHENPFAARVKEPVASKSTRPAAPDACSAMRWVSARSNQFASTGVSVGPSDTSTAACGM